MVYTSRGVLCWLPDIRGWARVVAHFVKPGGIFFITEAHPIAWALDEDLPLTFRYPYWEHAEPIASDVEGSYADVSADVRSEKEYSWQHGLGEIVTALIDAGLTIEFAPRISVLGLGHGVDRGGAGWHLGQAGFRGGRIPGLLFLARPQARPIVTRSRAARAVVPTGGRRSRGS